MSHGRPTIAYAIQRYRDEVERCRRVEVIDNRHIALLEAREQCAPKLAGALRRLLRRYRTITSRNPEIDAAQAALDEWDKIRNRGRT